MSENKIRFYPIISNNKIIDQTEAIKIKLRKSDDLFFLIHTFTYT